ncbi:extracellular solute-binding protein, partial [Candidatus Sumerlaeota bacterium]|nr:extracellular solute-binding protein [Candidatus Sumerlaeota bacterium]
MSYPKLILLVFLGALLLYIMAPSRSPVLKEEGNVIEITYMSQGGPLSGSLDDVVRAFERESYEAHKKDPSKPVYRVISSQSAAADLVSDPTRFVISVAGGMPPDVINFDRYAVAEWASRGAFHPLDEFIQSDLEGNHPDAIVPDRFYKAAWDEACYRGKVYSIPTEVDNRGLIYNKDLFRRAGLVDEKGEPTPPRTWEELREYSKKLTQIDKDGNVTVLGFAPNYGNSWFYFFSWMNDGEFMNEDGTRCTLNDPRNIEALQFIVDLYNDVGGYQQVLAFQSGFQGGILDPLLTGKIAMKLDGYWNMATYAQFGRDVDFGVAPPPVSPRLIAKGKKTVSWSGGWSYAIPSNAKNKAA